MRPFFAFLPALPLLATAAPAFSDCPAEGYETLLGAAALGTNIAGESINANAPDGENWKEIHCGSGTSGDLQKVGLGPSDPVDPQRKVGTWSIVGDTMQYAYDGGGGTYQWRIYRDENADASNALCWQENTDGGGVIAEGDITSVSCVP
ncbi:hypothetical protein [Thiohalocapsa halophila]|uniref:hypothetical protein n=1 Tax=Thiohalocapsa halophila TaxID=69359 RepID=UPI00190523B8|nr:hypothetical protein [Thiohalocapsa halophila]